MPFDLAASLLDLVIGAAKEDAGNRIALEGLTVGRDSDGVPEIGVGKLEAASLRIASGPFVLEIGRIALQQATLRAGKLQAEAAELDGVKLHGPLLLPAGCTTHGRAAGSWKLDPLAAAEGTLRAEILDAHLIFDADVTVPIRQGRIDFKEASVEHVGPDSRMGASRLGLYVDAPNGRSYLYQFPASLVPGVEYEKRGALLGPWVTERGSLQLQPFAEWLLCQSWGGQALAIPEQARGLFDRTAVSGDLQLGDGKLVAPGVQAELAGRAEGRNGVRLHSEAVGRALSLEMAALSVRGVAATAQDMQLSCREMTASLTLRVFAEGAQLRFAFELAGLKASGLALSPWRSSPP